MATEQDNYNSLLAGLYAAPQNNPSSFLQGQSTSEGTSLPDPYQSLLSQYFVQPTNTGDNNGIVGYDDNSGQPIYAADVAGGRSSTADFTPAQQSQLGELQNYYNDFSAYQSLLQAPRNVDSNYVQQLGSALSNYSTYMQAHPYDTSTAGAYSQADSALGGDISSLDAIRQAGIDSKNAQVAPLDNLIFELPAAAIASYAAPYISAAIGEGLTSGATALGESGTIGAGAASALTSPVVSGALGGAATGAATGALGSALNGTDVGTGTWHGALGGAAGGVAAPLANAGTNALVDAGVNSSLAPILSNTAVQGALGAGVASIEGNNALQGAEAGLIKGGATGVGQAIDYGVDASGHPISIQNAIKQGASADDLSGMGFSASQIQAALDPSLVDNLTPTAGASAANAIKAGGGIAMGQDPATAAIKFGLSEATPGINYLTGVNFNLTGLAPAIVSATGLSGGGSSPGTAVNNSLSQTISTPKLAAPKTQTLKVGPTRPSFMSDTGIFSAYNLPTGPSPQNTYNALLSKFN